MNYTSKSFREHNFVLYDINDDIICYYDNFEELSRHINYELRKLVYEFNHRGSNIITVIIDNKKYKLATFC